MKTPWARPGPLAKGFSLVEVLAAISVLAILGLILTQVTTSITRSTKQSTRLIDASAQARVAFDRIGFDLAALIKRPDVDFTGQNFDTAQANTILQFLGAVTSAGSGSGISSSNNRRLSIVAYEIAPHNDNKDAQDNPRACLIRGARPIPWSAVASAASTGFMGLQSDGLPRAFTNAQFPTSLLPTSSSHFDVLAAGVVRMVVGFQLYPDNRSVALIGSSTSFANARGQIVYHPPKRVLISNSGATGTYVDLNRVSAIVIGLVIVDGESLHLLDATQATLLGNAFPTPADTDNKTPVQSWTSIANAVNSLPSTVPLPVRQSVRVFERTFPITPFPTQAP